MKRLFLRIWGLTVAAVILALAVETVVLLVGDPEADEATVAARAAGGARLARDAVLESRDVPATLAELSAQFGYPVRIVNALPVAPRTGVFAWYDGDLVPTVAVELAPERWLRLGPMPPVHLSSMTEVLLRAGAVLCLIAALLFALLKRVQRRLTALEAAAEQMADGALDTRVAIEPGTETETIARVFNRMAERVAAEIATRERLLRAVSHDLRTPLSRAQLGLHLLGTGDPDALVDQIAAIEADLEAMNRLIQQLLDAARFATPSRQSVAVAGALDALIAARRVADGPRIERGAGDAGVWPLDPQAFDRAIGNLLDNALRFATERIEVDARVADGALMVSVADDGPGISESERARVFEPFARAVQDDAGIGLGLSLVRAATRAHGGDATIDESASGGCRVTTVWAAPSASR